MQDKRVHFDHDAGIYRFGGLHAGRSRKSAQVGPQKYLSGFAIFGRGTRNDDLEFFDDFLLSHVADVLQRNEQTKAGEIEAGNGKELLAGCEFNAAKHERADKREQEHKSIESFNRCQR